MADEEQTALRPLPQFCFRVDISDVGQIAFQEVSGLDVGTQVIEYRSGTRKLLSPIRMPGMLRGANITCKMGTFAQDTRLWDWVAQSTMNVIERRSVKISLLDTEGHPTKVWKLTNAWPREVSGMNLTGDAEEGAIETLEFMYDSIKIENG